MSLKDFILHRINHPEQAKVWTAIDFLDLSNRSAVDKVLQRLVKSHSIRRIDRGIYDNPKKNRLTGLISAPDYQQIIAAISRRDQARVLIDGLTSANDLGLTNAVPGQINVLTDCRLKPVSIDNLVINFKHTAPSKLYWANRPAMRIVQAMHWLRDIIRQGDPGQLSSIRNKLKRYLDSQANKDVILDDLRSGLYTVPAWMQAFLKDVFLISENKKKN
jgi:hypothetical protein